MGYRCSLPACFGMHEEPVSEEETRAALAAVRASLVADFGPRDPLVQRFDERVRGASADVPLGAG